MPRNSYGGGDYNSSSYNTSSAYGSYGGSDSYSTSGGAGSQRSGGSSGRYDNSSYDYSNYYQQDQSGGYGSQSGGGFGTAAAVTPPAPAPAAGGGGYGSFDKLQEQLSLRESQLAMASTLLEQQSRLIADVSSSDRGDRNRDRDRGRDRRDRDRGDRDRDRGGRDRDRYDDYDRKRSGSDRFDRFENKRRRMDSGSYDDRRERRSFGDRDSGGGRFGGRDRGRDRDGGSRFGGDRRDSFRSGGRGGRGEMSGRDRDRRGGGGRFGDRGGRGGGFGRGRGGGRGGGGNRSFSQADRQKNTPKKQKIIPRVSKELSRHYCHVCEVECFNERNYQNHLNGTRHNEKVEELEDNPSRKIEVEERMRKQEEERAKPLPVKEMVDHCDICDLDIQVTLESHLKFKQHRHRETQVKKGCSWCNVGGFVNFSEVLAHRLSDAHKEMREKFGGNFRPDSVPKPDYCEEEDIPAYQEDTAIGVENIIAVTGFFCKLCNKFYKKEEAAKNAHCSSEAHYDKWKQSKMDAIADYKQKLAEQKEREELALKRIQEKQQMKNQNNGDTAEKMETDGETNKNETETMETETADAAQSAAAQSYENPQIKFYENPAYETPAYETPQAEPAKVEEAEPAAAPEEAEQVEETTPGEGDEWVGGETAEPAEITETTEAADTPEASTPTRGRRSARRGRGRGKKAVAAE